MGTISFEEVAERMKLTAVWVTTESMATEATIRFPVQRGSTGYLEGSAMTISMVAMITIFCSAAAEQICWSVMMAMIHSTARVAGIYFKDVMDKTPCMVDLAKLIRSKEVAERIASFLLSIKTTDWKN